MRQKLLDLHDECRTKKRRVPTHVAEAVEFAQELLRSEDIPVHNAPSLEVLATTREDSTQLAGELDKAEARTMELKSLETIIVRQHEELLDETKQRHAKVISIWKETSAVNADSLINNVNVAKADSVKMFVKRNVLFARFEEHVRALQNLVNFNVDSKADVDGSHGEG